MRYAWAQAMYKWLIEDVSQIVVRVQARCTGKKTNIDYLKGCTITLNIWFYELNGTKKMLCFSKTPRILCYVANSFQKQAFFGPMLSSLEGKEVISY